jgi:hypothetical protein
MTVSKLLGERIARQGFVDRPCVSPAAAAALTTALQAQDNWASRLGVRARSAALTDTDVRRAIDDDRTIVRTWLMRGTIHLIAADDLRWLVRLIGPAIARKYRTRWRQIGLTDDVLDRSVELLPELLADGPLTRHEIRAALAERGVTLESPDPQAHTHAIVHASTTGLICRGPDRGTRRSSSPTSGCPTRRPARVMTTRWPSWPAATLPPSPPPLRQTSPPGPVCRPRERSR